MATAQGKPGIWLLLFPDRENTGNFAETPGKYFRHKENVWTMTNNTRIMLLFVNFNFLALLCSALLVTFQVLLKFTLIDTCIIIFSCLFIQYVAAKLFHTSLCGSLKFNPNLIILQLFPCLSKVNCLQVRVETSKTNMSGSEHFIAHHKTICLSVIFQLSL